MLQGERQTRSGENSSRVRFSVVAFLCVLSFLTYYDRQCIVRAQENIQNALAIDDEQMGLVLGAFWLAYALFEIPGGWMGDRIGARFTLTRMKQDDGARYFGPFTNSGAIRRTLHLVRRQFNLRGCRPLTPTEADYKHCLYGNLKFCTAPCIGNVTRDQYLQQVNAACDFLSGQCGEMADQLEAEMRKSSGAQDYEKAAQLRDVIAQPITLRPIFCRPRCPPLFDHEPATQTWLVRCGCH